MSLLDPAIRTATGLATQAEATGRPAPEPTTLLEESWRDFIYAEVWTRPALDRRARYLIGMASAASTNGPSDLIDTYVRGALRNNAVTLAELREGALHLAVYAGWSRGTELDRSITRIATELDLPPVRLPPIRQAPWDPKLRIEQGIAEFDKVMTFPGPPPVTPYFEAGIDSFVFGEMWGRPGLDQRSRRWITLVGVCESCAVIPINSHIHAAMASGNCTADEMQEFVLHYAIHGGWPKASVIQGAVLAQIKNVAAGLTYSGE